MHANTPQQQLMGYYDRTHRQRERDREGDVMPCCPFVLPVQYERYSTYKAHLITIVGPAAEFHFASLVIEWKPSDVYLACRLENTRRNVQARSVAPDDDIRGIRPVESLVRAAKYSHTKTRASVDSVIQIRSGE